MTERVNNSAYFKLFEGEKVPLSSITQESPLMIHTIDMLVKRNAVIGQYDLWGDLLLWMPGREKYHRQIVRYFNERNGTKAS